VAGPPVFAVPVMWCNGILSNTGAVGDVRDDAGVAVAAGTPVNWWAIGY
jgi:hypothetical protein